MPLPVGLPEPSTSTHSSGATETRTQNSLILGQEPLPIGPWPHEVAGEGVGPSRTSRGHGFLRPARLPFHQPASNQCRQPESNWHAHSSTAPSTLRVCHSPMTAHSPSPIYSSIRGQLGKNFSSLRMTIRAQKPQILPTTIQKITIDMINLQTKQLAPPQSSYPTFTFILNTRFNKSPAKTVCTLSRSPITFNQHLRPGLYRMSPLVPIPRIDPTTQENAKYLSHTPSADPV